MPERRTGHYVRASVAGESVDAFVPLPLPPTDPPLEIDDARRTRVAAAEAALSRLALAGEMVPSLEWFVYAFVRKEAVLSSQIEGTQASLVDVLSFEASGQDPESDPDIEEVCNYVDAMNFARSQLAADDELPLSMRLLNETHARLLRGTRGADKKPGEIRRTQNWIGGRRPGVATFVPPPPHLLAELLSAMEHFIHADDATSPLVRAGWLHVQFETIHPYLDGNGRIGRLLVTLLLEHWRLLPKPLLYLSLFFKRHRLEYYERLGAVRTGGDWEGWIDFFLDGVETIADEAVESARSLFTLLSEDRGRLLESSSMSVAALRLFELLPRRPIVSTAVVVESLGVSKPTAGRAIEALEAVGILVEVTGRRRDRTWAYQDYLDQLQVGTELDEPR